MCHPNDMARGKNECEKLNGRKRVTFQKRVTVTLDDDVLALTGVLAKRSKWKSRRQMVNATMRKSMLPFAPDGFTPSGDSWEHFALKVPAPIGTHKTKKPAKAMRAKRARRGA